MKRLYDLTVRLKRAWHRWRAEWYHMHITGRGRS